MRSRPALASRTIQKRRKVAVMLERAVPTTLLPPSLAHETTHTYACARTSLLDIEWGAMSSYLHGRGLKSQFAEGVRLDINFS
jgi:hypothetical protein